MLLLSFATYNNNTTNNYYLASKFTILGLLLWALIVFLKVFSGGRRLDGGLVRLPVGRAHLAVLVGELEGLDQSERFVHRTTDGQIVDGDLAHDALRVDDEQAAQSDARLGQQHTVVFGNLLGQIGDNREGNVANATLLARCVHPGQVRKVRVHRHAQHLGFESLELVQAFAEGDNLRWADKSAENENKKLVG